MTIVVIGPLAQDQIITPNSKSELVNVIIQMFENNITDLNCIDTSKITDMSN